ncbi:MAG: peptidylprolyl isomerase [Candidatus Edwardsbacteria bacterium]|nr:peptidylprolyl isomerase [Candidatus Edwardsbacteria bacterium]
MRKSVLVLLALSLAAFVSCKKEEIPGKQAETTTPPAAADAAKITKPHAILDTDFGSIEIELLTKDAPISALNFMNKAAAKAFDGTTFHRLVPGFVIQGGDPNSRDNDPSNDGTGGERMDAEPRKLSNLRGTVSMASSSRAAPIADQSDMQFFINLDDKCARLDGMGFIPFGKVVKGMEVVDQIARQPRDGRDRPTKNVVIKSVTIVEGK